jgi:hypothetical protein
MAFWSIPRFWLVFVASIALLILAAKSHGRQLRLERELEGHTQVSFVAPNHPWVEALWTKDRERFTRAYPTLILLFAAYAFAAYRMAMPLPFPGGAPAARAWSLLVLGLPWGVILALTGLGMLSLKRFTTAIAQASVPPSSTAGALWASASFWVLTLAVAIGIGLLAARRIDT